MVDFLILVEGNSNTTKNTIIAALIDGNSTGTLGVVLIGNISIEEITELSSTTDIPTTKVVIEGNKGVFFINTEGLSYQNHQGPLNLIWTTARVITKPIVDQAG